MASVRYLCGSLIHFVIFMSTPIYTFQRGLPFLPKIARRESKSEKVGVLRGGSSEDDIGPAIQPPVRWADGQKRALVLMDVFSEYHGHFLAEQARNAYGVATVSVLSNYMKGFFEIEQPEEIPSWKRMFIPDDEEFATWAAQLEDYELVGISCESDSGLDDAEKIGQKLNVTCHNGVNEARRNKYLMLESVKQNGLPVVQQQLCRTVDEAVSFAEKLGVQDGIERAKVIVKPIRGVASDDVYLCKDLQSVRRAFFKIHGSPVFGSPWKKTDVVLVQEFAVGQEYAIDMVCKDGEKKIAAIWKYDKRPANGAPFVYFATEIYDGHDAEIIYDYLSQVMDALDIRWGMSHNEIIMTKDGPRLIEVNCRQHNMDFLPLTMFCIGYNAFDMLLAAYFGAQSVEKLPVEGAGLRLDWDALPALPRKERFGQMVHLSCFVEGELLAVNEEALMEIQNMDSVFDLEIYGYFLEVGNFLRKTVDIRTDCGWVQMLNADEETFKRDYERIIELMPTLFEVDEASTG